MPTKKILIVEDSKELQMLMAMELESAGFEVIQAYSLSEANECFNLHKAELSCIIMDNKVGHNHYSDGLVRQIRESGFQEAIIAFSSDSEGQDRLMAAGCSHRLDYKENGGSFVKSFLSVTRSDPSSTPL